MQNSITVYPRVFEDREDESKKFLVIHEGHSLKLSKGSVLSESVLLRDFTESGVRDTYPIDSMERSSPGGIAHRISAMPDMKRTAGAIQDEDVASLPPNFTVELMVYTDYYHTSYFDTVGLRFQQLDPPGSIAITAIVSSWTVRGFTTDVECLREVIRSVGRDELQQLHQAHQPSLICTASIVHDEV
ncbi:hypothetical protein HPB50_010457 [Hyalomma asiaticum]|uniref:Uncharacterized protein n=1 Tax=Hyalomma asiaticum TaxID=266040 RepID=A0ACB7RRF0_HYAAI|nr:hypothetical protein HPB50_010457 [Hyalomma asiaticum]